MRNYRFFSLYIIAIRISKVIFKIFYNFKGLYYYKLVIIMKNNNYNRKLMNYKKKNVANRRQLFMGVQLT